MFIRWHSYRTRRPRSWHRGDAVTRCRAILVESHRVNGEPRLKHIACIASYDPGDLDRQRWRDGVFHRAACVGFWRQARKQLDRLAISPEDRITIEAALALRIPVPTAEDERQADREREELWQRLRESIEQFKAQQQAARV
jgi:hypothetical protein